MAIHAVSHKSLGIVDVGGGFPGVVGELNLMAGCAELGRGCPDHGIIGHAENREGNDNSNKYKYAA